MKNTTIAIDLAKSVFEVGISDRPGHVSKNHRLSRAEVSAFLATQPPATVIMEACSSSHYWGRKFEGFGHTAPALCGRALSPNPIRTGSAVGLWRSSAAAVITRLPLPSPTKWPASFGPFGNLGNRSSPDLRPRLTGSNKDAASRRICLMSFQRHGEIYPKGWAPARRPMPRLILWMSFQLGYSSAGCSPAEPASASPAKKSMRNFL